MRAIHDWVIDADTHITEPGDVWTARLPAHFQDDAPRIVRDDDGRDSWVFGTSQRIVPIGVTAVAGWPEPFPASPKNMDEIPAAAHDAKARLEYMDPLWAAAADTRLPVSFHIGSGDFTKDFAMDRIAAHGVGPTTGRATISLFLKNAAQVTDLLLSGVLPRFPDTRFVSVESGVGWVPFVLESADYTFEYSNVARERPEFTMKPSEYFHRQVYAYYFYEEHSVRHDLDAIGVHNVLFETDYPHPVCLYGNVREKIEGGLSARSDEEARQLLWSNAASLYRVAEPDRAWQAAAVG